MKIIGLTGGIGSGKSTLLKWFNSQNIPCFESDKIAKMLLEEELKKAVIDQFGSHLYPNGFLDRKALANLVFANKEALLKLNTLVHPAVGKAFQQFIENNKHAPIVVKEAAILFETGNYKNCDFVILVCAPIEDRILRVIERDGVDRSAVIARMANQWDDAKKRPLADYVIENTTYEMAVGQLKDVFRKILDQIKD